MGVRKPRYFLVYYYDDEARTFNATGPITDDRAVTDRTVELQKTGRRVRISTSTPEKDLSKVPSPQTCTTQGPAGYKYDPTLRW